MSIDGISEYISYRSIPKFMSIIESKMIEIDNTIKRLQEIKQLLDTKKSSLIFCEDFDLSQIEVIECKEEYLLLSKAATGNYDDKDFCCIIRTHKRIMGL